MQLRFDCESGVSGDMLVGALADLGAGRKRIVGALSGIAGVGFRQVFKKGVKATKFDVKFNPSSREYVDLLRVVDSLKVSGKVKTLARRILKNLAAAEAEVHQVPLREVHLHEAVDSVVDAVAFSVAFEDLGLMESQVYSSVVNVGRLAPASELIVKACHIPVRFVSKEEIATPTGLAILAALDCEFSERHLSGSVGYGAGEKDLIQPNVLKATLGAPLSVLETNVDDCTAEQVSYAVEVLMSSGALDVHVIPCLMKKGRLGYLIRVLTSSPKKAAEILMRETGTLGVRVLDVESRMESARELQEFSLKFGGRREKVRVKKSPYGLKPEYDDCARIASSRRIPLREVQCRVKNARLK